MSDEHDIVVASNERSADHIGIGLEARRGVVARQVHRHHIVAFLLEEWSQQLPAPRTVPSTVHQDKRRHAAIVGTSSLPRCENRVDRSPLLASTNFISCGEAKLKPLPPSPRTSMPKLGAELRMPHVQPHTIEGAMPY